MVVDITKFDKALQLLEDIWGDEEEQPEFAAIELLKEFREEELKFFVSSEKS